MLRAAEGNPEVQAALFEKCRASCHFFINYFAWTYRQREVRNDGSVRASRHAHVPFITWPSQDMAITDLIQTVEEGLDGCVSKSREEGASWLCLAIIFWFWRFHPDSQILVASRVEDLVDNGEPTSLFWKLEYLLDNLPDWMVPGDRPDFRKRGAHRNHMILRNPENGSAIIGQATTAHIGRGGRYLLAFFDEMAMMENGQSAWDACEASAVSRWANSTPLGPGTAYSALRRLGWATGQPRVIPLMYWNHPEKGRGRVMAKDVDGSVTGETGRSYWDCPWLRWTLNRVKDPAARGQNIFADDIQSGQLFFSSALVTAHRSKYGADPVRCEIRDFKRLDGRIRYRFEPDPRGRWYVWLPDQKVPVGHDWVMFLDPAHGLGGANSCIAVMDPDSGEVVAEFVDAYTPLEEVADEMVLAARHLFNQGLRHQYPLLGWETNGPGEAFYMQVVERNGYRRVYRRRPTGSRRDSRSDQYGWTSSRRTKRVLLDFLATDLADETLKLHSEPGLMEMLGYQFDEGGAIVSGTTRDEKSGARDAHGDRVIAYAGCCMLRREMGVVRGEDPKRPFPPGTMGHLLGFNEELGLTPAYNDRKRNFP